MLNSPLGGISFLINLIIVIIGSTLNYFRRNKRKKYILTQDDISKMERSKLGSFLVVSFVYIVPTLLFTATISISFVTLHNLYKDEKRITIVDILEKGVETTGKGAHLVQSGLTHAEGAVIPIQPEPPNTEGDIVMVTIATSSFKPSSQPAVHLVFNQKPKVIKDTPSTSTILKNILLKRNR